MWESLIFCSQKKNDATIIFSGVQVFVAWLFFFLLMCPSTHAHLISLQIQTLFCPELEEEEEGTPKNTTTLLLLTKNSGFLYQNKVVVQLLFLSTLQELQTEILLFLCFFPAWTKKIAYVALQPSML